MINSIGKIYYKSSISLFTSIIRNHKAVKAIILNGSVANESCSYFKSDIDISIILLERSDTHRFITWYRKRLFLINLFCPYFLPLSERIQNVYLEDELEKDYPNMYRGYLKNSAYKILYGKLRELKTNPFDTVLFWENKINQLVTTKKISFSKLSRIETWRQGLNKSFVLDNKVLEKINFLRFNKNEYLNLPTLDGNNIHIYHYKNLKDLIHGANEKYIKHRNIKTIHYMPPLLIYIDLKVKVLYQERLPQELTGKETKLNKDCDVFFRQDQESLDFFYLNSFLNYKPFFTNDLMSKKTIFNISNYLNLYVNKDKSLTTELSKALNIIINKPQILKLSLCICTKDRKESLLDLFKSISFQERHPDEIVIINNGEIWDDRYVGQLKKYAQSELNIFESDLGTISALRNFAIQKSQHEIVSFVDDDCILTEDWIYKVYEHFRVDPDLSLLGGCVVHHRKTANTPTESFHRLFLERKK